MPDLSVIIPIYNTPAQALERCFSSMDSLAGLSFEVLLIDDGSAPATGEFCRDYVQTHPEFRYCYKENGGVSSARNYGLDQAAGQHVMFVDADDEVLGAPITADLLAGGTDLTVLDMLLWENGTETVWHSLSVPAGPVSRELLLQQLLTAKNLNSPCVKLFRRELIEANGFRFRTDFITGEDWLFVTEFVSAAQSFSYVDQSCYRYYRDGATSSSRLARFPDTMLDNCITMYEKRLQIIEAEQWKPESVGSLRCAAAVMLTEDLFNSAGELLLLKLLTAPRKEKILAAVGTADKDLAQASLKTRLKAFTLLRFPAALWMLAKLREVYLKVKQ